MVRTLLLAMTFLFFMGCSARRQVPVQFTNLDQPPQGTVRTVTPESEFLEANDKLITTTNLDFDCHTAKISPEAVELYSDIKDKKSFSTQKVLKIYNLNKEERDRAQNFEWSMLPEIFAPCADTYNLKKLKGQIDQIKNQPSLSSEVLSVGNKNAISPLFSNANPDSNYFPTQAGTQKNLQKEKKANLILEAKNKFQKFEKANCPIGTFQSDKEWVQITDKGIHFSNLAPKLSFSMPLDTPSDGTLSSQNETYFVRDFINLPRAKVDDLKNVKKIIGCELDKNGQKQLRIVSFTDDTDPYLNTAGLMAVEHIFTLVSGNGSIFIQHSVGATKITSTHETFIERIRKDQILPLKP